MFGSVDPLSANQTEIEQSGEQKRDDAYSPVQSLLLRRLTHLIFQRQQYEALLDAGDWRLKLLRKAIYSTYCDCVELGIATEAKTIFHTQSPNKAQG